MAPKTIVRFHVYEFIKQYKVENDGNSPSYQEIADYFGTAIGTAYGHVQRLMRDGKVRINKRGLINLVGGHWEAPHDPLPELRHRQRNQVRTSAIVSTLYKQQNGKCWWCGRDLLGIYEVDHRVAYSKGGTNDDGNLCLACPDCNSEKSDKMPWEFNGRLL